MDAAVSAIGWLGHELLLFAACGFILGGVSDLAVDFAWIVRSGWRRAVIYRHHSRATAATLVPSGDCRPVVVFVPAWDEATVIGPMLRTLVARWPDDGWRVYVGTYPNDPATAAAVRAVGDARIRCIVGDAPGPTTKARCLNHLWQALLADECDDGITARCVVLHDAEDVVHADEFAVYDALTARFDLVQLPVLPLTTAASRWVAGHYADEFAESHGKTIVVREALGAAIPAAGVGCAFARAFLERVAAGREGPFDADSLTEDYELGLRLRALGGRGAFVRIRGRMGDVVAVRAYFPDRLDAAVMQKSRWIAGIALSGWDRLGWQGGVAEWWMRSDDRRALIAGVVIAAAYLGTLFTLVAQAFGALAGSAGLAEPSRLEGVVFTACLALLGWRLVMRAFFVWRAYGWREAARSVPRVFISNVVAILAARRAVGLYRATRRDGIVRWTKTSHRFPDDPDAA